MCKDISPHVCIVTVFYASFFTFKSLLIEPLTMPVLLLYLMTASIFPATIVCTRKMQQRCVAITVIVVNGLQLRIYTKHMFSKIYDFCYFLIKPYWVIIRLNCLEETIQTNDHTIGSCWNIHDVSFGIIHIYASQSWYSINWSYVPSVHVFHFVNIPLHPQIRGFFYVIPTTNKLAKAGGKHSICIKRH